MFSIPAGVTIKSCAGDFFLPFTETESLREELDEVTLAEVPAKVPAEGLLFFDTAFLISSAELAVLSDLLKFRINSKRFVVAL